MNANKIDLLSLESMETKSSYSWRGVITECGTTLLVVQNPYECKNYQIQDAIIIKSASVDICCLTIQILFTLFC